MEERIKPTEKEIFEAIFDNIENLDLWFTAVTKEDVAAYLEEKLVEIRRQEALSAAMSGPARRIDNSTLTSLVIKYISTRPKTAEEILKDIGREQDTSKLPFTAVNRVLNKMRESGLIEKGIALYGGNPVALYWKK